MASLELPKLNHDSRQTHSMSGTSGSVRLHPGRSRLVHSTAGNWDESVLAEYQAKCCLPGRHACAVHIAPRAARFGSSAQETLLVSCLLPPPGVGCWLPPQECGSTHRDLRSLPGLCRANQWGHTSLPAGVSRERAAGRVARPGTVYLGPIWSFKGWQGPMSISFLFKNSGSIIFWTGNKGSIMLWCRI